MGDHKVSIIQGEKAKKNFIDHLLKDIEALELMLNKGMFESGITRIGAEQEVCLVDPAWRPAPINLELLEKINDPLFTTELARFNIEINLDPMEFRDNVLSQLENKIRANLLKTEKELKKFVS